MPRPPIPNPPYTGACLCGAVHWRLEARPLAITACHCNDCKKLSGSSNILVMIGPRDAFHAEGQTHRYRKRADSGREADVMRCANCGTRLWHEPLTAPQTVLIAAGTLDDPSWVEPAAHIWTKRISPGVAMQEDTLKVEGQPADRTAQIEAFTNLYPL
jgi:hypothetical protein